MQLKKGPDIKELGRGRDTGTSGFALEVHSTRIPRRGSNTWKVACNKYHLVHHLVFIFVKNTIVKSSLGLESFQEPSAFLCRAGALWGARRGRENGLKTVEGAAAA